MEKETLSDKRMISEHSPYGAYEHKDVREAVKKIIYEFCLLEIENCYCTHCLKFYKIFGEELTR